MPEVNKPPLSIDADATLQDGLDLTAPLTGPSTCSTSRSLGAVAAQGGAATSHAASHATSAIDSLAMVSGHAILLAAERLAFQQAHTDVETVTYIRRPGNHLDKQVRSGKFGAVSVEDT